MLQHETAGDPARLRAALAGLRRYQGHDRAPRPPEMPVIARIGRAAIRDYGGDGPPALFVPSLINPPHVLDLAEGRSLLRWLATQGVRPLLLDWGTPAPEERDRDVAGHVEQLLLPLLRELGEPVALAGYCLGGTMALAAAARHPVRSLALIAAPWHFSAFARAARDDLAGLWNQAEPTAETLGVLPMEALQASFWRLDPARTIRKFEDFGRLPEGDPRIQAFIALEDWANDGPPLTLAAGRQLLVDLFGGDITGKGGWLVAGAPVDPAAIACPVLDVASLTDRIVPAASAAGIGDAMRLDLGHVGMIVGSRGRQALWEPLAHWLSQPRKR
ncbi:Poly(3-hydroxyalkanoate) synthetase-like protein [Sphingomonas sp. MM-1]|uniref:alpha/beta hydrolase n=1 Tax=Sphingomonas sp. MM-1 TaxID=745310 RepID=UPI0002C116CF|nr:alpha/beta hydrolase [Sphingomonas sp. MM-1]AGH50951.1 Poly(3-hydroxyalkanoate) synthetase-like protein [Sphingomonas sp. MM-1]